MKPLKDETCEQRRSSCFGGSGGSSGLLEEAAQPLSLILSSSSSSSSSPVAPATALPGLHRHGNPTAESRSIQNLPRQFHVWRRRGCCDGGESPETCTGPHPDRNVFQSPNKKGQAVYKDRSLHESRRSELLRLLPHPSSDHAAAAAPSLFFLFLFFFKLNILCTNIANLLSFPFCTDVTALVLYML